MSDKVQILRRQYERAEARAEQEMLRAQRTAVLYGRTWRACVAHDDAEEYAAKARVAKAALYEALKRR